MRGRSTEFRYYHVRRPDLCPYKLVCVLVFIRRLIYIYIFFFFFFFFLGGGGGPGNVETPLATPNWQGHYKVGDQSLCHANILRYPHLD